MVGQLYQLSARDAKARATVLLDRFSLGDAADRTAKTYSGGMRRRLDLAAALVVSPPVMFMDEPTTGLDPRNRQQLWDVIEDLVAGGTTLLLTTQYLERPTASRTTSASSTTARSSPAAPPTSSRRRTGGERVEVVVHRPDEIERARSVLASVGKGDVSVVQLSRKLTVPVSGGAKLLAEIIRELDGSGVEIDDIALRRPTLDDVFLSLTGHAAEANRNEEEDSRSKEDTR